MIAQRDAHRSSRRSRARDVEPLRFTPPALALGLFTVVAMVFGGGGSVAPGSELVVQLASVLAILAWVAAGLRKHEAGVPLPRAAVLLALLALVLPLVQLVPLPQAVWSALPGREVEASALRLIGRDGDWMPLSMTPTRTWNSLLAIVPAVAAMLMAASLNVSERRFVIGVIAVVAGISLAVGTLQLSNGFGRSWRFYDDNVGYLNGFQANRNAQADVLLIGLVAVAATMCMARDRLGRIRAGALGVLACLVLAIGCFLTGSRMGIALLALTIPVAILVLFPARWPVAAGAGLTALLSLVAFTQLDLRAVEKVTERFQLTRDFREELWTDTWYATGVHWPFGSGVGSFRPIFIAAERLEVVDPSRPVRAHNDYLEFMLEGGLFAVAVMLAVALVLARAGVKAWRRGATAQRAQVLFALCSVAIVAIHSLVDYPLRSMALAHLAAIAAGVLMAIAEPAPRDKMEIPGA